MANSEKWAFRELRGPKDKIIETVAASAAPVEVKAYLAWMINQRACEGVVLNVHAHDGGEDFIEHLHIKKLY